MTQLLALILPVLFSACGGGFHLSNSSTAPPVFIQVGGSSLPSSSTISVVLPSPTSAGSLIVVAMQSTASVLSSITDSVSNTYQSAQPQLGGGGSFGHLWYALNSPAGPDTITANFTTSGSIRIIVAEYTHASALVGGGQQTGTTTTATASLLVGADNSLIVAAAMDPTNLTFTNGSFISLKNTTNTLALGDGVAPHAGAYGPTINLGISDNWIFQSAAFK